jgi:hypothetical protein
MAFYMDILAPIIEEYPRFYVDYVENENYLNEAPLVIFLELAMEYEEHIQQWLLKVEEFSHPEIVCIE